MKISKLKSDFQNSLSEIYPSEEIQSFFNILSEKYLKLSRIEMALNPEKAISVEIIGDFENALFRLKNYEPIQYIIGETEFFGLNFKVNKYTLIPRPETEELVEWILVQQKLIPNNSQLITILDIGTGSGCIAISLSKNFPDAKVSALDISEEALQIARKNAELNEVETNFFQADILTIKQLPQQYDIIVSNPPYVRELEKKQMQQNVLNHEPQSALFVANEDPLVFYRTISRLAKMHLKPNGKLFFEINEYLGEDMKMLLKSEGFQNIEIKKDIFGKDRMLKCTVNEQS
ncbi:peptide chain release factor N(5)-glutamine methyltransferase [Aequorivita sp. SDUM287046]|uniref:Release factor glutamine methyltransferase n=1 Tax=Aequorivita aurantiaca TaxID=3053356 RepID=A0ABT8DN78_9FLAO|nr:peptide chain release factor N(5)-glutamine methyltransferase [Aequorivita aurantiaca]MDN3725436.1 peptide chain release factor N(5)-glutamine methyltransferase [Aequorivita aurantiaca]